MKMNEALKLELTKEEATELEKILTAMREANEQIARDQIEIEILQAETREIITRLKKFPTLQPYEA